MVFFFFIICNNLFLNLIQFQELSYIFIINITCKLYLVINEHVIKNIIYNHINYRPNEELINLVFNIKLYSIFEPCNLT